MAVTQLNVTTNGSYLAAALVTATGSTTARTLGARFAEVANPRDFGAVGSGVADDTTAIQTAVDAEAVVFLPSGTYKITAPITLNDGSFLFGTGKTSTFNASSVTGAAIRTYASHNVGNATKTVSIENLRITGSATQGVALIDASLSRVRDITIEATVQKAFYCGWSWGLKIDGCQAITYAPSVACLHLDSASHACQVDSFYTGGLHGYNNGWSCPVGILITNDLVTGEFPQVLVLNTPTIQGVTRAIHVYRINGDDGKAPAMVINGPYTEAVTYSLVLGRTSDNNFVHGVQVNGGELGIARNAADCNKPHVVLYAAGAVSINNTYLVNDGACMIAAKQCYHVKIDGCALSAGNGSGDQILDKIKQFPDDSLPIHFTILNSGNNTFSPGGQSLGGVFVLPTPAYGNKHFAYAPDHATGALQATAWTPGLYAGSDLLG